MGLSVCIYVCVARPEEEGQWESGSSQSEEAKRHRPLVGTSFIRSLIHSLTHLPSHRAVLCEALLELVKC